MSIWHRVLRWLATFAVLALLAMLIWQCVDVYLTGAHLPPDADVSMYSMDDVVFRIRKLSLPMGICLILILASIITHVNTPVPYTAPGQSTPSSQQRSSPKDVASAERYSAPHRNAGIARLFLYIVAIICILVGLSNGGLFDVFVKAINICTECIGLG